MAQMWSSYLFNTAFVLLVLTFLARLVALFRSNRSLFGFLKADHSADGPSSTDFDAPWAYQLYRISTFAAVAAMALIVAGFVSRLF